MLYISLGVIIIYLLEYGILEIDMKFKICVQNSIFRLYFSIIHTSNNVVIGNLKSCMAVGEIYVKGTMSHNFVLGHSLYFMQKNE